MKKIFHLMLVQFKHYRRSRGGTWFRVYDIEAAGGMESGQYFWTQEPLAKARAVEIEIYKPALKN